MFTEAMVFVLLRTDTQTEWQSRSRFSSCPTASITTSIERGILTYIHARKRPEVLCIDLIELSLLHSYTVL